MIIIEAAYFVTFCFFTIFSLSGLGQILIYKIEKNFFESVFYGFIVAAFFITLIHFFVKISIYLSLIILLVGFLSGSKKYFSKIKFEKKLRKNFYQLIIVFFFLIIFIYVKKNHDDFGYYHTFPILIY